MKVKILLYGIARDIIGDSKYEIDLKEGALVLNAMDSIKSSFPEFNRLTSLMIAINDEYASDSDQINDGDTLVLIPPVSGG